MPKITKFNRNPDYVTVYHRSYNAIPPHKSSSGRKHPTFSLQSLSALQRDDEQFGPVGTADMEELASKEVSEGFYSGLRSDDWRSAGGNPSRDREGVILSATTDKRVHGPKTVFTGPLQTVKSSKFEDRVFSHRYKVPKAAIADTVYADDDIGISPHSKLLDSVSPVPLRRDRVIQSGQVHQMANSMEGPSGQRNLVFAKKDMDHLGIQFAGTLVHVSSLEDTDSYKEALQMLGGRKVAFFDPYKSKGSGPKTTRFSRIQ